MLQKTPFLRISFAFAAGIVIYPLMRPGYLPLAFFALLFLVGMIGTGFRQNFATTFFPGVWIHLFLVVSGMLAARVSDHRPVFYEGGKFVATVMEVPREKANAFQAVLKNHANFKNGAVSSVSENVMCWFEKGERAGSLKPGDQIIFDRSPREITNRGNPFEFDYKNFLSRKKIFRSVYLAEKHWIRAEYPAPFSLTVAARRIRLELLDIYQEQHLGEKQLQILSALTLGYKQGLDPRTKNVFANAGAMHVLAVSGLHVGIIYFILNCLLAFLRNKKAGKILFVGAVLFFLWFYAFLTGLSPSVTRAATMFSFLLAGKGAGRQVNVYNSLAAAAFFMMLFNPPILYQAGFQLSFAAVSGIVYLQPRLEKLVSFKWKVFRYFWTLLTVSVAAQVATFPLTAGYFHQFPVFFWISNLFVIPAVTLLVPAGFVLLAVHTLPLLPGILSKAIHYLLGGIFDLLQFLEKLPFSLIEVNFLPAGIFFAVGGFFFVLVFLESRRPLFFKWALAFVLLLFTNALVTKIAGLFRNEIIVYNYPGNAIVHLISGRSNYIVSENEIPADGFPKKMAGATVRNYRLASPLFFTKDDTVENGPLLLRGSFLFFEGRILKFGKASEKFPEAVCPDLIIGPVGGGDILPQKTDSPLFITTRRLNREKTPPGISVYSLPREGAYREKW